jgi:hypothetical protein
MTVLPRRSFFKAAAGCAAAIWGATRRASPSGAPAPKKPKVALLHATDLFRPHNDPDDHFDLATAYALAAQGRISLLAVMIDHPPAGLAADPDVLAVAQMSRITGLSAPVLTGSLRRPDPSDASAAGDAKDAAGAMAILEHMRRSTLPVAISIVGSSRDVALAGRIEPKLFAEKCTAIYLNAGSGTRDKALAARLEYNVGLDPASYAAIFDLPCPLYWLPCFEVAPGGNQPFTVAEFGTFYRFPQKDVLPHLSKRLKNYFAFMFKQGASDLANQAESDALRPNWLRYLEGPNEDALLERQGAQFRNMWSTAGFLHAAGLAVSIDGGLGPLGSVASPVYSFDPIRVRCGADGVTEWSPDPGSRNRSIFHVRDVERYPVAMTAALGTLLRTLG